MAGKFKYNCKYDKCIKQLESQMEKCACRNIYIKL